MNDLNSSCASGPDAPVSCAPANPLPVPKALTLAPAPLVGSAVETSLPPGTWVLGVVLAALAAVAFVLSRRQQRPSRQLHVMETASLGPRRSLVVAQFGGQTLLIGSSEAGLHVLTTRPEVTAAAEAPTPAPEAPGLVVPAWLEQLKNQVSAKPAVPDFQQMLNDSVEDHELRRKLAAVGVGAVRS